MDPNPNLLNYALQRLAQLHVPGIESLKEGLSEVEIRELLSEFPCKLTKEVHQFYQWRNGIRRDLPQAYEICPGILPISLEEALENYKGLVSVEVRPIASPLLQSSQTGLDLISAWNEGVVFWDRRWLPIFSDYAGDYYFVVCDQVEVATSPVYHVFLEDSYSMYWAYDSLTAMLLTVVNSYETGAYHVNEAGFIDVDRAKLLAIENEYNPLRKKYLLEAAGNPRTLSTLVDTLASAAPSTRMNAYRALMLLADDSLILPLSQQLHYPDPAVRLSVTDILGALGGPNVVPALKMALNDEHEAVRRSAAYALRQLKDQ